MGARLIIPVDDKGAYSVSGIYPGVYTLTVSAPNFADVVFDGLNLTPGKKLTLDATLEAAGSKPAVETNAAGQSKPQPPRHGKLKGTKAPSLEW